MNNLHEMEMRIVPSGCDKNAELKMSAVMDLFMDQAMLHAEELKVGISEFWPRNLFWIATKSKYRINRKIKLSETVKITTWPEEPGNFKCIRYYEMTGEGGVLVQGKTEWVVVNTEGFKPIKAKDVFPQIDFYDKKVMEEGFERIRDVDFEQEIGKYTVRSVDIDYGKHMNNVAYIRAIEGLFTSEEWERAGYSEIEIQYRESAYEGDTLTFYRKYENDKLVIKGMSDKGDIIVFAILGK